ncbi:NAD-dependent epimerase/dehydratase family protein [Leptospira sp. GIMC2001]|uniref:NAD-dependent epimerase/dehydratase family protein n=1 Tax=Leptospira sp. GIMC2001 TaxID=1513297 RepID=UPI00234AEF21|nr:NAD-dependent epimerase/dehydratase family protein [Leptospira sp. GIMC2001]WCL51225.1 NAD-dependent epimerase/dehydratase family protein [Leptospira sp. GIMC2001]
MKVLVTGADGFLGKAVVEKLNFNELDIISVTRRENSSSGFFIKDLGNPKELIETLDNIKPQIIINLAAVIDFSENSNISFLHSINILCPAILADWAKRNNSYLIQASSIIIHGTNHNLYNHFTPESPDTDYGLSKYLAEQMIVSSGCDYAILRFGGLFGKNGPIHLGINVAIEKAKQGIVPSYTGEGKSRRNYLHIKDAATMIDACVKKRLLGIYFCGGEVVSFKAMLTSIAEEFNVGSQPGQIAGLDSQDQIVEVSSELNFYKSFADCLKDC